ncbi:VWA domain-containing protein [Acidipila sp. EB88]|uniref:VWA domain-containing protein n=1 Tax=Acidipila sp. EB88 TaxID=2305226 RepID=UPI000F5DE75F|nr:VWA domain-containing protein [Acidipila sp. EB88]RRA47903.1 VWA domain-containing protein [Acidipila sp. EB88]
MRTLLLCLLAVLLSVTVADTGFPQTVGQNKAPDSSGPITTISVRTQLVVEAVTVADKNGKPVPDLTAKDFALTEDGVPQRIRFVEHQALPTTGTPLAPRTREQEKLTIYKKLSREQIAPEKPESLRYENKRLLALYFDMSAMDQASQFRALHAAETFVRTQMTPADLVSVLRFSSGAVDVLQDFTADRDRLLSILETMVVGEGQEWATVVSDASAADQGSPFGQDDSEFNIFKTDRQLAALQTAAEMLGHLNERKVLLYFASGLTLQGVDNQAQLHATVDAAIRAGVSFWPVDARGLVAEPPMGDATQGSPGGQAMYTGAATQQENANFQQSQDTLYSIAGDTGGKALLDTNDLAQGIQNAQRSIADYYILGYYTSNAAQDGKFRHVKVTVDVAAAAKLEYRQGYYAAKEFSRFTQADKERQLEDALMLEDPMTELTIAMELNYFQLNRAEYFVPLVVKIPGRELALAKRGGAEHTLIDFIGEVKDVYGGSTVSNVRDNVNLKLTDQTEAQLAKLPVEYETGFTLLPGKYSIKLLARDDETGRIGTYETTFTIPNLNREEQRVPMSTVVLSSERQTMQDALYNAAKGKDEAKQAAVNPLVSDGVRLIPSVTRVFHRDGELYVYLQGYEPAAAPATPLLGYVDLYQGDSRKFESGPVAVTPPASDRLKPVPMHFTVPLGELTPGEYVCQISVVDPASGKTAFWRAAIRIDP